MDQDKDIVQDKDVDLDKEQMTRQEGKGQGQDKGPYNGQGSKTSRVFGFLAFGAFILKLTCDSSAFTL